MVVSGCTSYSASFKKIEVELIDKNYINALNVLDDNKGNQRDEVLYWMNRGMILRMNHDYEESNKAFEQVKLLSETLQALSVSEEVAAVAVNEGLRAYAGENYEIILVHLYKAFNYLELGDTDNARVEALQIDVKLQALSDEAFNDDAFSRYLMGVIFETLEEWDDALIAYRKAYEAYRSAKNQWNDRVPTFLKQDLLRLTDQQGFNDELTQYKNQFKSIQWETPAALANKGELIILFHSNLVPRKQEHFIQTFSPKSGRYVRISTPYYERRPARFYRMRVKVGNITVDGALVEDIEEMAVKTLESQMPGIITRAVARAVVKTTLVAQVEKRNALLGLVTQVVNLISERADTRSWLTLPQNIYFARIPLIPGHYDNVIVQLLGTAMNVVRTENLSNISIKRGNKVYRSIHAILP